MNDQVEVTWQTLRNIPHSIMVHAQVSDEYIYIALINMTDHIFTVIPIKHLVNQDGDKNTRHKLATGMNTSVSNLRVLFCPCVVQKESEQVDTKALNTRHKSQKGCCGIFFWNPTASKRVTHRRK